MLLRWGPAEQAGQPEIIQAAPAITLPLDQLLSAAMEARAEAVALLAALRSRWGGPGGSSSTGGDVNSGGQAGGNGLTLSISASASQPGGASYFGGGAVGVLNSDGVSATNYGAGGSGAATQGTTSHSGGSGSQGVIVVWEFQ